jgi:hypothetical protein
MWLPSDAARRSFFLPVCLPLFRQMEDYVAPRPLSIEEIPAIVQQFR